MRNVYHICKFFTLTISFSKAWPEQILDLGKQFNLMIRLENVIFARCLEDVLKMSWRRLAKTSWRCLEDVFARYLEDIFKTSSRRPGKTSWRRLENVLKTSSRHTTKTNILVLIKTSWRRLLMTKTKDIFKTSSLRRVFAGIKLTHYY